MEMTLSIGKLLAFRCDEGEFGVPTILRCINSCDSPFDATDNSQVGTSNIAAERAREGGGSDQYQTIAAVKAKELLESQILLAAYLHPRWLLSNLTLPRLD